MRASLSSSHYLLNNKPVHYLVLGLVILLTLYCLSSTFSRGVANAWYFNAEFSLNDWAKQNTIKDKVEYAHALTSIKKAQSLDPTHPHYAHMVGRIMHWGVDMGFEDKAKLAEINQWYLLATQLRPLWPDPWVDLLRLNNVLHGYNDETKYYIEQALATGPYIDLVTVGTLQVWLLNWSVLSGTERQLLFKQFDVATKQDKTLKQVLDFANVINREKLLCSQLKFNPKYSKQKDSYLYKRYCLK
ncbi:VpsP family polysaccharide biosynthesis protein [Colwellia sp. TT2012]|uniref:VpsP family polysaccharide biosynthesis protein n=1 Tax=Colwellia sp. TT2012 TaxID=1720342 RepID=UPI00071077F0|nr:VpsP family polysaccharide biosynthesis protein [Colwellia sp. TT2012]